MKNKKIFSKNILLFLRCSLGLLFLFLSLQTRLPEEEKDDQNILHCRTIVMETWRLDNMWLRYEYHFHTDINFAINVVDFVPSPLQMLLFNVREVSSDHSGSSYSHGSAIAVKKHNEL